MAPFPRIALQRRWAPPLGAAQIDWSHPLAQGLVVALVGDIPRNIANPNDAWGVRLRGATPAGSGLASAGAVVARSTLTPDTGPVYSVFSMFSLDAMDGSSSYAPIDRDSGSFATGERVFQMGVYSSLARVVVWNAANAIAFTGSVAATLGLMSMALVVGSAAADMYVNATRIASTAGFAAKQSSTTTFAAGGVSIGAGTAAATYVWANRALAGVDVAALHADPFQMLR